MSIRRFSVAAVALGLSVAFAGTALAQTSPAYTAAIHAGTCAEPGALVQELQAPRAAAGQIVGVDPGTTVMRSETDRDDVWDAAAAIQSPHIVAVFADGELVACGAIGGALMDDDELVIGLGAVAESGHHGIAKIDEVGSNDDDLDVDLYVVAPAAE